MGDHPHASSPAVVRSAWLDAVVGEAQRIAGRSLVIDPEHVQEMLVQFARSLRPPITHVERLLLRSVLLDVAWKCGTTIHKRAHHGGGATCRFAPAILLDAFWNTSLKNPEAMFTAWADGFCTEFFRTHRASVAGQVAALIRKGFQQQWSLDVLARRFHVTPSQLRRAFRREFGVSIHDYQKTRRVIEALHQMPDGKVEAVALDVGYKSKKDFYRAFQEVTGMMPTTFRRLSDDRASHVVEMVGGRSPQRATAADRRRSRRPLRAR